MRAFIAILSASLTIVGCATAGKDVVGAYVSPMQYASYDCNQIRDETARLTGRVTQLSGRLDEAASNDKAIASGGIFFFPALFALGGTKSQEAELARLKGEAEALQSTYIQKKCS